MPDLKEIIFSITNRCNLRCRMCNIPEQRMEELSAGEWKEIIKDASLIGAHTIVFSGGEPLLRNDIFELISFTRNNRMLACLTSNGHLVNEEVAFNLSQAGVNVINISIEGDKNAHDYLRGNGSFDKAASALENLRKHRIESTIASTVSRYNYESLINILELAREYGATTVRFQPFNKLFLRGKIEIRDFFIDKNEIAKAQDIVEKIIKLANRYNISTDPVNYLRRIPFYLSGNAEKAVPKNGCSALFNSCPVNSRGDVYPCWAITNRENLISSLKEERLFDVWFSRRYNLVRKRIVENGCPGCLMSCYDDAFGTESWGKELFKKIKKIDKPGFFKKLINRLIQLLRRQVIKLRLRIRFYKTYRGSFGKIIMRIVGNIRRQNKFGHLNNKEETAQGRLLEILSCKEKIEKELSKYL